MFVDAIIGWEAKPTVFLQYSSNRVSTFQAAVEWFPLSVWLSKHCATTRWFSTNSDLGCNAPKFYTRKRMKRYPLEINTWKLIQSRSCSERGVGQSFRLIGATVQLAKGASQPRIVFSDLSFVQVFGFELLLFFGVPLPVLDHHSNSENNFHWLFTIIVSNEIFIC